MTEIPNCEHILRIWQANLFIMQVPETHSMKAQGFSGSIEYQQTKLWFEYASNTPFLWLSTVVSVDNKRKLEVIDQLPELAAMARNAGCSFFPHISGSVIQLEFGVPLYISGLQYYAVSEVMELIVKTNRQCMIMFYPSRSGNLEAESGNP